MFLIMYNENDNEYVYVYMLILSIFIYFIINLFKRILYSICIVKKK